MAAVTKGTVSLATTSPPTNCQLTKIAAADLAAGTYVYLTSADKFDKADGTANDAKAAWWGITVQDVKSGEAVTAYHSVEVNYGTGLTPGARLYIATTAGGLDDSTTTGGTVPAAIVTSATRIFVNPPGK